ncbi:hypothetical protein BH09BAC1_BH09BAC1_17450 [soil metagenome]
MQYKFFLLPTLSPYKAKYQFGSIIIAEGLKVLGQPFFANINYWKETGASEYTFATSNKPADVHIYESCYVVAHPEVASQLDKSKINVLIDLEDKLMTLSLTPTANAFDIVLRAHYTTHLPYPAHVHPWPFALSNRIITSVNASIDQPVFPRLFSSYRVHLDVRKMTNEKLVPLLSNKYEIGHFESEMPSKEIVEDENSYWYQTGRRHDDAFYVALNQSLLSLTFGGSFIPAPFPSNPLQQLRYLLNRSILKAVPGLREKGYLQYIIQYDSWRWWESLISNACPIFLDFEQCGFKLPVMPVAGKHYLDVDLTNIEKSACNILALTEAEIKLISQQGKEWALEHYSPVAVAKRFMDIVATIKK